MRTLPLDAKFLGLANSRKPPLDVAVGLRPATSSATRNRWLPRTSRNLGFTAPLFSSLIEETGKCSCLFSSEHDR